MTTTTEPDTALPPAIDEFLQRIATANWEGMRQHLTEDVLYDASVPGWRYQYQGADRVVQEYAEEWSGKYRWSVVERHVVSDHEAVALLIEMRGEPATPGAHPPVVCRLTNLFRLDGDRIAEHRYTCCGEWSPETVEHIANHAPRVEEAQS